jgi:hypothetical protein
VNPTNVALTPIMNNAVIINDQLAKVNLFFKLDQIEILYINKRDNGTCVARSWSSNIREQDFSDDICVEHNSESSRRVSSFCSLKYRESVDQ